MLSWLISCLRKFQCVYNRIEHTFIYQNVPLLNIIKYANKIILLKGITHIKTIGRCITVYASHYRVRLVPILPCDPHISMRPFNTVIQIKKQDWESFVLLDNNQSVSPLHIMRMIMNIDAISKWIDEKSVTFGILCDRSISYDPKIFMPKVIWTFHS